MIYLVTKQQQLFDSDEYTIIPLKEAITKISEWDVIQFDIETSGRDPHLNDVLCAQFGNREADSQIVVDTTTVDIRNFKKCLEEALIVGQNLKFDIQFLYNFGIVPRFVYDTMIVEQLLYLGYPPVGKPGGIGYSLQAIIQRYLDINVDKTVRGEIIWRGLDSAVIKYAAGDVTYLEDIMDAQLHQCVIKDCIEGAKLECDFVPVIAYLEWSGIKLEEDRWRSKMQRDLKSLNEAIKELNQFVVNHPKLQKYVYKEAQGDLWSGFDLEPKVNILWTSSAQVIQVAKILGFDTKVQDKNTGEDKDTVIEKHLKKQKGINDEFLKLYFGKGEPEDDDYFMGHQGAAKLVSSFGQGHIDAINPITGRIHTVYRQLGADTGRMASGSNQLNEDLARYKGILKCSYPNMQQLPADKLTRSCFVADEGNLWVSCDYSSMEARLGADIYNERSMQEEFLHGSGDIHSLVAKSCFPEVRELSVKEIKAKYPHLRSKSKGVGFSQQFGGSAYAIQNAIGGTIEESLRIAKDYNDGFPGIASFKAKGEQAVRNNGYILLNPITGHKTYWPEWKEWRERTQLRDKDFWDKYSHFKKTLSKDDWEVHYLRQEVSRDARMASKWTRKALNSPTQGSGTIILKESQIKMFKWVVDNNYFNICKLCSLVHDEVNWEFPEEIEGIFPNKLKEIMETAADKYCKSLPIPAEASVGKHWIH